MTSRNRFRTFYEHDPIDFQLLWPLYSRATVYEEAISDRIDEGRMDHPATHTRAKLMANCGSGKTWSGGAPMSPRTMLASGMVGAQRGNTEDFGDSLSKGKASLVTELAQAGRTDFHAISFLRELTETYSMLRNPFGLAGNIRRALRDGSKQRKRYRQWNRFAKSVDEKTSLKRIVTNAENTWLEGIYGWQPFVGDMLSASNLLKAVKERQKILKTRDHPKYNQTTFGGSRTTYTGSPVDYKRFWILQGEFADRGRTTVWGDIITNPSAGSESLLASAARACNIDRLGYAVWDAVPYSFVLDWFFPIGETIDKALSGPALVTVAGQPWVAQRTVQTYRFDIGAGLPYYQNGEVASPSGGGTYHEEFLQFSRYASEFSDFSDVDNSTGMHGTRIPSGLALGHGLLNRIADACKALR